ncbi:hypothetical protein E2C01_038172 [Portunus trituberculatus]|uniref:Uncharacterized protein n=1 Tax=Portunus trituberculatus TaxID=210409 RepID=A0A5B7FGW4_PORTR|nr:hypothetical protein [Portunus trituberculatus]
MSTTAGRSLSSSSSSSSFPSLRQPPSSPSAGKRIFREACMDGAPLCFQRRSSRACVGRAGWGGLGPSGGSVFHKVTVNFPIGHHGTSLSDCSPQNNASSASLVGNESVERERQREGEPETNWIPPSLGFISAPI